MALSNIGREPRREITEQVAGLLFILAYIGWVIFSVHLSRVLYIPHHCIYYTDGSCRGDDTRYFADQGDFLITLGLSIGIWLIYPFLLIMHGIGEWVCDLLRACNIDPRPKNRY